MYFSRTPFGVERIMMKPYNEGPFEKPYEQSRANELMLYVVLLATLGIGAVLSCIWYLHNRTPLMGEVVRFAAVGCLVLVFLIAVRSREISGYELLYWLALIVSTSSFTWRMLSVFVGQGQFAPVDIATFVTMSVSFWLLWREPRKPHR